MKVWFPVLVILALLSSFGAAEIINSSCVQNCTTWINITTIYNVTQVNYTINITQISNVTILPVDFVFNLTTRISDLQTNLTICNTKIETELRMLQNQSGYVALVGVIQNQTIEISKLQVENQLLKNNVSIYSDGYLNFRACMSTKDNAILEANNRTASWQKQYADLQQQTQTYIYVGVGLVVIAYLGRPTIEKIAKERFGSREIGEREA